MSPLPRILLVEDDLVASFLHQRLLQRLDVAEELVAVANGAQALDYLTSLKEEGENPCPTLILLDLHMPILDGWTFLEIYGQLPFLQRQAPVVVLAVSMLSIADLERLQELPVAALLYKPLTAEKVKQLLRLIPASQGGEFRNHTIPFIGDSASNYKA